MALRIHLGARMLAPISAAILAIAVAARETAMPTKMTTVHKARLKASAVIPISDIIRTVAARATAMAMPTRMTTVRRQASADTRVFMVRKTATRTMTMARQISLISIADRVAMDLLVGRKASIVAPISAVILAVPVRAIATPTKMTTARRRAWARARTSVVISDVLVRAMATPTKMTTALKVRRRASVVTTDSTVRKTAIRMTIKMGRRIDAISIVDRIATALPGRRRAFIIITASTDHAMRMTTTIKTVHPIDAISIAEPIQTTPECRSDYSATLIIPA